MMPPPTPQPGRAVVDGIKACLGAPIIIMSASFLGFGSLIQASNMGLWAGLFSTFFSWALPGQVITVEGVSLGASVASITLSVFLTNVRLLPLTVSLLPHLRATNTPKPLLYLASHLVAVTSWAVCMRRCPDLPEEERLPFFLGFACLLWVVSLVFTIIGFYAAGTMPPPISLGLILLSPYYFLLVLVDGARDRARVAALCLGLFFGPLFHLASPEWGLLATGLIGGSLAYGLGRLGRKGN
ncbi:MAG: AzlC family ABC transporter permease [Rhodospirillales bacterium]